MYMYVSKNANLVFFIILECCQYIVDRRDVVFFGVDEYDDPLLTYYDCKDGACTEIYDLKCNRTCDHKLFDFGAVNVVILQGSPGILHLSWGQQSRLESTLKCGG